MSKYGNKKWENGGKVFDSRREARRYAELRLLDLTPENGYLPAVFRQCRRVHVVVDKPRQHSSASEIDFLSAVCR